MGRFFFFFTISDVLDKWRADLPEVRAEVSASGGQLGREGMLPILVEVGALWPPGEARAWGFARACECLCLCD